tara:strand:- start:848 stop:2965 length:2118 start_codon:yes stop_codon:yes gene_type:complete
MAKKTVSDQMELFEDGGFKDQGQTKDPISRNPVPIGSIQKEVRDDIPAQLSEGEFVLPADVVRYHGLEKIMGIRDQAKKGLQKMENMGQMGNSDEATLPDGTPFKKMAVGGNIPGQAVGIQQPQILQPTVKPQQQQPVQGVNVNPAQNPAMRQSIYAQPRQPIFQPPNYIGGPAPIVGLPSRGPGYKQPTDTAKTPPKYDDIIGAPFGQLPKSETRVYKNPETDEVLYIPFINGEPLYPIPNGYVYQEVADKEKKEEKEEAVKSTSVRKPSDDGGDDQQEPTTGGYKVASALDALNKKDTGVLGKVIGGITSAIAPGISIAKMFADKVEDGRYSGLGDALTPSQAEIERLGLTPAQAREQAMGRALSFMSPQVAGAGSMAGLMGQAAQQDQLSLSAYGMNYKDATKAYGIAPSFKFGTKPGDVDKKTGNTYGFNGQASDAGYGDISYSSYTDFKNAMEASDKTGWYGGYMTDKEIEEEQSKNKNFTGVKAKEYQKEIDAKYGKKTEDPKVDDTKPVTTPVTKPEPPIDFVDPGLGDDDDRPPTDEETDDRYDDPVDDSTGIDDPYSGPGYDDPYDSGGGDSGDDDPGDSNGKIVCTTMNRMYGLPMYSNKVWMRYNKYKNLDSAWELGYHKIFLSLVKQMPTNKYIRGVLEWLAKNRTHGVKEEMKGNIFTINTLLIRPILGPVVYITGKLIQKGILKKVNVKDI